MPFTKSQLGGRSRYGNPRRTPRTLNPWGNIYPKRTVGPTTASGQGRKTSGRAPGRTLNARSTPDSSIWGMSYPINDPKMWPVQHPAHRSDLGDPYAMTAGKAAFQNAAVNHAFQRVGYAG